MKKYIFIIAFAFTASAYGQIGVGHSVKLWGKTIETVEISYQVDRFTVYYFHNYSDYSIPHKPDQQSLLHLQPPADRSLKRTSSVGIGYHALDKKYFKFSPIFAFNRFPNEKASRMNFILELRFPITNKFSIGYKHLSNGFGLRNRNNVGYDSFSISLSLY